MEDRRSLKRSGASVSEKRDPDLLHSGDVSSGSEANRPSSDDDQAPTQPRDVHGIAWIAVVFSILSATFLYGLDQTIVANIQPAIVNRFDSMDLLPWIPVAFLLGAASSNLFWGQMYGHFNAKWLYIVCVFIFEVGSAVCGAAPTMEALIIGRAICGWAGSGMYTGSMTLLSLTTTEKERAFYLGLPGLTWGVGTILGPILGGVFTESSATWRWAFYINLCVGALAAPIYIFLVPNKDARPGASFLDRLRAIDLLGFLLMVGTFTAGLMAISFGGVVYPWNSGSIIALFVVAGVVIALFWVQQIWAVGTTPENRSFPLAFLKNPSLLLVALAETSAITATFIPIYFLPLLFQFVRGDGALTAGVRLLPYIAFCVATCIGSGYAVSATGHWLPWFLGGGILVLAGSVSMLVVDEFTSTAKVYGFSILLGAGAGSYLQLPFAVAQMLVSPAEIPAAVGFMAFAQLSAPSITMAIANAIFLNGASRDISRILPTASSESITSIISGLGGEYLSSLDRATQARVIHIIVENISMAYILCVIGAAVTIPISVYLWVRKLSKRKKVTESLSS